MSGPQWRERPDKPMHEDNRLQDITQLVNRYRQLWQDADFADNDVEAENYYREYMRLRELVAKGVHYEPRF